MDKITTIQPDQWKNLGNVLKPINNQGSINIRKSKICQDINNGVAVLTANIPNLIGENINLDIMSPHKHVKLFKLLESDDNDVDIFDDSDNEQYIATNGKIRIYLPKQIETVTLDEPDYEGLTPMGEVIKLDKTNKREIETILKSGDIDTPTDLLIKDGQLMGIEVKDTGIYLFPDYVHETTLSSDNADLVLKSLAFMIIPGDEFEINLGKGSDDKYLLITSINTGFSMLSLNEDVDEGGDIDGFDLI